VKKKRNIYILIGLSLALLVAAYYVFREDLSEWNYNLDKTKTNAYGTFLTYELIKSKYDSNFIEIDNNVVESFRTLDSTTHYNYIFINHFPYYDSATIDTLCRFAYAGNTVFIGAEDFYGTLRDSIIQQLYHLKIIGSYAVFYEKNRDSSHEDKLKQHLILFILHSISKMVMNIINYIKQIPLFNTSINLFHLRIQQSNNLFHQKIK